MSLKRNNPLGLDVIGLPQDEKILEDIRELDLSIRAASDARQSWLNKQEKLYRQRLGIRRKKIFPWPGANNHSWPLIDEVIRRWKPAMSALILQARPVAYFFPNNPAGVAAQSTAQSYYDFKFSNMTGVSETVLELLEHIAQNGLAYTRQGWEYKTERQCRVIRADSLFPNGIPAAVEAFNAQIRQAREQVQAAVVNGEADAAVLDSLPPEVDAMTLVIQTLEDEYSLRMSNPLESQNITEIAKQLIDGADRVKIYYRLVRSDKPSWKALSALDVVVPPRSGDIENADFVAIRHRLSVNDLLQMAADGNLDPVAVSVVVEKMKSRSVSDPDSNPSLFGESSTGSANINSVLDTVDGIDSGFVEEPDLEDFLEVYCHLDINGDGIKERCVLWYHPEMADEATKKPGLVLALFAFPYPFFEWPIVRFEFEHRMSRPYASRGIAEHLSVHQATKNKMHNSRLDASQMVLAPMLQMRANAPEFNRNIKFMPGTIIPVTQVGDIAPIAFDINPLVQAMNEENMTKREAQEYIGVFDPGVLAEGAAERRTATEVEAIVQQTQSIFGQDARLLQNSMAKVHRQLWQLLLEFGPDEDYLRIIGEPQPKLVKRHEIAFDYDIQPSGTPATTSRQLAQARARELLAMFWADTTGFINKHELAGYFLDTIDPNLKRILLRSPEQAALIQQMFLAVAQSGQQPANTP